MPSCSRLRLLGFGLHLEIRVLLLQLVYCRIVFNNALDLVYKHDSDEESEEYCTKASDSCNHNSRRGRKQEAVLIHADYSLPNHENESVNRSEEDIDEELEEELLVVKADAVVDPRAVMVHASDASAAD